MTVNPTSPPAGCHGTGGHRADQLRSHNLFSLGGLVVSDIARSLPSGHAEGAVVNVHCMHVSHGRYTRIDCV